MIYFDNNATTAVAPEVAAEMASVLEEFHTNPSSAYAASSPCRRLVSEARAKVASLLGAANSEEVVFTSGGTESDNWAILGALRAQPGKRHVVTTAVEHEAVRKLCARLGADGHDVTVLGVNHDGLLSLDELAGCLRDDTAVVSVMLANNETGVVFPIAEIAEIVKSKSGALFHVDGVNAAGKIAIDLKGTAVDLFSISAHKFHGPKGIGALYIRSGVDIAPMMIGGGQENARRAGTEPTQQIAGMGRAAELVADLAPMHRVSELRDMLEDAIIGGIPETRVNGAADRTKRLPNTSNISFKGINGEMILARLDEQGICVSTGSACNASDHSPSAVLQAMGVPYEEAMGAIRFSLGRFNTAEEIHRAIAVLPGIIRELGGVAGSRR